MTEEAVYQFQRSLKTLTIDWIAAGRKMLLDANDFWPQTPGDSAEMWRIDAFHGLELLRAHYSQHSFPRHLHATFVIEVVEQGVDQFLWQGATYAAPAGSIILFNPYEVHTGRSIGPVPLQYRSLYPSIELLCEIAGQLYGRQHTLPHFRSPVIDDRQLAHLLRQTHRALHQNPSQLEATSLLTQALSDLIQRHAMPHVHQQRTAAEHELVQQLQAYLTDHLTGDVTLQQLADVVGYSPFHLLRIFRQATGLAPYEYLTNLRITQAKQLVAQQMPLATVAAALGFYDQSHLHRHFKRIVGVTPGEYARNVLS